MATLAGMLPRVLDAIGVEAHPGVVPSAERVWRAVLGSLLGDAKVDRAVHGLVDSALLSPAALAGADPADIAEATGLSAKSSSLATLRRVAAWLAGRGDVDGLAGVSTQALRDELQATRGVGPGVGERVLLHGLGRPGYPLDSATFRISVRHAWIEPEAAPDEVVGELVDAAGGEATKLAAFAEAMALIGSKFCKPSVAKCDGCPLAPMLPEGGPRGSED